MVTGRDAHRVREVRTAMSLDTEPYWQRAVSTQRLAGHRARGGSQVMLAALREEQGG